MKHKLIALTLALTALCWAQSSTPSAPSTPSQSTVPAEKGKCPCCDKATANTKDGHSCCANHEKHVTDGKEMSSCCGGKDATSCMAGKDKRSCCGNSCSKDKGAAACGKTCIQECKNGCCGKKTEKAAGECCHTETRS